MTFGGRQCGVIVLTDEIPMEIDVVESIRSDRLKDQLSGAMG